MPAHPYHCNIDLFILGRKFNHVHDMLDAFAKEVGPNHRDHFHDDDGVAMVFYQTGDIYAAWSAFYHITLDFLNDDVGVEDCIAEFMRRYWSGEIPPFDPSQIPPSLEIE
ncbi:MAG: hypothetical protein WC489_07250 [Patescibacteria group bacterium]